MSGTNGAATRAQNGTRRNQAKDDTVRRMVALFAGRPAAVAAAAVLAVAVVVGTLLLPVLAGQASTAW